MTLREVVSAGDPAWEGWKIVYYDSFPINERMTEGYFLKYFEDKAKGDADHLHMLVYTADDSPNVVLGIAYYDINKPTKSGFLWYLAVREEDRDKGIGTRMYHDLVQRIRDDGARSLIYELEIPGQDAEASPKARQFADRRIAWYRRQGARLLGGVDYLQSVDGPVEPTPMHLAIHSFDSMTAEEAFELCKEVLGDALRQTGSLSLA